MLDLGLEHLGIDVGKAKYGVQAVVMSVGRGEIPKYHIGCYLNW
jgi:hypothetical protein